MELEALKRQLAYLDDANINISKDVTDRHTQVTSYMAEENPDIDHAYMMFGIWLRVTIV